MRKAKSSLKSLSLGLLALIVLLSFSASPSAAGPYEYKEYTVKKGDTLWSITKRELVDAYQWPLVWMENQRINDPDLIFPGQIVLIPIRVLRPADTVGKWPQPETVSRESTFDDGYTAMKPTGWKPPATESKPKKPVYKSVTKAIKKIKVLPIVKREVIIESGYITKYIPDAGEIQGAPSKRFVFALHDILYIWTKNTVSPGQRFYVVRKMAEVEHPITEKNVGWSMKITGVLEALEGGEEKIRARVIESYDSIHVGDSLDYYSEHVPPVASASPRSPDITGNILIASYRRLISARHDVLFIDKGLNHGVEIGDMFITLLPDTDDSINGMLQVVNVRNESSLALIHHSVREITKGDVFRSFFDEQRMMSEAFRK
jgi:hypothetical protein